MQKTSATPKTIQELRRLASKARWISFSAGLVVGFVWDLRTDDLGTAVFVFVITTIVVACWLFERWEIPIDPKTRGVAFPKKHGAADEGGLHSLSPYHLGGRSYESYYTSSHSYRQM